MGDMWRSLGQATAQNKCLVMKEHFGVWGCGMLGSCVRTELQRDEQGPGTPGLRSGTHSCLVSVTLKGEALNLLDFRWALPPDGEIEAGRA